MFVLDMLNNKMHLPNPENALPGRDNPISEATHHFVNGRCILGRYPDDAEVIYLGMGCFWGAERLFWSLDGVHVTGVGYSAGYTPNPTYKEVCTGLTGHNEVVLVVYKPSILPLESLLQLFWQSHDPTQGMAQGNDRGTQYRSGIYTTTNAQQESALASRETYQNALDSAGRGAITTEILPAGKFYLAEEYHQQYLAKNPEGYCGLAGTGVTCPIGG